MKKDFFSNKRRLAFGAVVGTSVLAFTTSVANAATSIPVESFSGNVAVSANGIAGGSPSSACLTAGGDMSASPIPGCGRPKVDELGSGVLRLTSAFGDQTGYLLYNSPIPAAAGLDALFYASQWGGDGADGISFFFTDGSKQLTAPGGNGGSLGYAVKYQGSSDEQQGVAHALLGVGFDVYGNFPSSDGDGIGCTNSGLGMMPNGIGIRGPGNGATGYCWIDGVDLTPLSIDLHGDTRESGAHLFRIRVDSTDVADRKVTIYVDGTEVLSAPLPQEFLDAKTVKFGWTGGTGGSVDNHEVWGATVNLVAQPDDFEYEAPTLQDDRTAINSTTTTVEVLANTGSNSGALGAIVAVLLLAGAALVIQQRRRIA